MYIKFETDAKGDGGSSSTTVHCSQYHVEVRGDVKIITLDDNPTNYLLGNSLEHYQRAFVMNENGNTIDTIHPPSVPRARSAAKPGGVS